MATAPFLLAAALLAGAATSASTPTSTPTSEPSSSTTAAHPERRAEGPESRETPTSTPKAAARAPVDRADPVATVREAEQRLRAALGAGAGQEALAALAAEYLDYQELARRSVGRRWAGLSRADRAALVAALRALLEATYLSRLQAGGEGRAEVTLVRRAGAGAELHVVATSGTQAVPLDLRLQRGPDGRWRVYDATVAGLALLEGYQEQLPQLLELGGVKRLLAQLELERQAQVARRAPAAPPSPAR